MEGLQSRSQSEAWVETFLEGFEVHLREAVRGIGLVQGLARAADYIFSQRGKRIRPLLGFALWADLSGNAAGIEASLPLSNAMISLEFLHNSSLLHDDLPALDNDDMRRGMPSCHKQFGEATAVLLGDALIAGAFHLAAEIDNRETTVRVFRSLSSAFISLCNGQELDMRVNGSRGDILELYQLKTGALFASTCEIASLMCPGTDEDLARAARKIGFKIGEWFQICDDYLDSFCSGARKGRQESSDTRNNKETFFVSRAFSVEQAQEKINNDFNRLGEGLQALRGLEMARTRQVLSIIRSRVIA